MHTFEYNFLNRFYHPFETDQNPNFGKKWGKFISFINYYIISFGYVLVKFQRRECTIL